MEPDFEMRKRQILEAAGGDLNAVIAALVAIIIERSRGDPENLRALMQRVCSAIGKEVGL
jgi:hypothetical protein